jgi:lysophospholipase L1-like esterase
MTTTLRHIARQLLGIPFFIIVVGSFRLAAQSVPGPPLTASQTISPADSRIQIIGRVDAHDPAKVRIAYPGVTLQFRFTGDLAMVELTSAADDTYVSVIVEGGKPQVHRLSKGVNEIAISAADLAPGPHTVEVVKRTETWQGVLTFTGLRLGTGAALVAPPPLPVRKLLFIGDSVTCGAGVDNYPVCPAENNRHSNGYDAYGMVLGRRLDAQAELVCYGGRGVVRDYLGHRGMQAPQFFNYSVVSDDENLRAKWTDDGWTPDAVVISLGTNDWNLQKSDPIPEQEFVSDYLGLVRDVRKHYPHAWIVLTQGSIVSDPLLSQYVQETVMRAADPHVVWFASRHFPGSTCDAHPDKMQHIEIADDLEVELRKLLGW